MSVASVPKRSILHVALMLVAFTVACAAIAPPSRAQEPKALADDVVARLANMASVARLDSIFRNEHAPPAPRSRRARGRRAR